MIRKTLSLLFLPVLVATALFASPTPARAAPPSGHARGYSGAFHADPLHSGAHHAAPHSGFHSGPFIWYGGYPNYGSGYYPSYGYSYYPDYGSTTPYYGTGLYPLPGALTPSSEPANSATSGTTSGGQVESASLSSPISADSPAQITVRLSEGAEIWFDGMKRDETGSVRQFTTPVLSVGTKYIYEIHARWVEGDTTIDQTRKVVFGAGDKLDVTFPVSSGSTEKAKEMAQP